MFSVSNVGLMIEPESRLSRLNATGPLTSPRPDQLVDRQPEPLALAEAEVADPGGQALDRHVLARQADPAGGDVVVGEELHHQVVEPREVGGVAARARPPERPPSLAGTAGAGTPRRIRGSSSRRPCRAPRTGGGSGCRTRTPRTPRSAYSFIACSCRTIDVARPLEVAVAILGALRPPPVRPSGPTGCTPADRGPGSSR